ncbi:unnamed protein product [Cylindrotheca closterium]|uniref:Uncharacterized protein n=1 Tax=Cylindrotheca closterium TaxID=2856 RepID=A0AAD2CKP0_9STRA|nr:unnamed protein product [Cylindrotheca closterium]
MADDEILLFEDYAAPEDDADYDESDHDEYYIEEGETMSMPQHERNAMEEERIQLDSEEKGGELDYDSSSDLPLLSSVMNSRTRPTTDINNNNRSTSNNYGKSRHSPRTPDGSLVSNELRLSLALDAAQLGKLTRLNEHVVTAVATEESKKKKETDWTGIKAAHNLNGKSAFIRVCIEAAAMGRLHRGSEKSYTVSNYDESEEEANKNIINITSKEAAKGMIDTILETMQETEYQLDEILNELEVLQEVDPYSIEEFLPVLDTLKSQVDALTHHLLYQPNTASTRLEKVIDEQREDISKSWAHHLTVIEDMENFQNTKDTFDDQNLAVIPCFDIPTFKKPTFFMTKGKQRKAIPLQAAKEGLLKMELLASGSDIRVRSTCHCPYCKKPSSFQTQSYKHMRERKQANDATLKNELVGLARKRPSKKIVFAKSAPSIKNPLKPTPNLDGGMQHGLSWKSPRTQRRNFREAEARRKLIEQQKAHMLPAIDESDSKVAVIEPMDAAPNNLDATTAPLVYSSPSITTEKEKLSATDLGSQTPPLEQEEVASPSSDFSEPSKPRSSFGAGILALVSPRSSKGVLAKRALQNAGAPEGDRRNMMERSASQRLMDWLSPSSSIKKNKVDSNSNVREIKTFTIPGLPSLDGDDDDDDEESTLEEQLATSPKDNTIESNANNGKPFTIPGLPSLDDDDDDDDNEEESTSPSVKIEEQPERSSRKSISIDMTGMLTRNTPKEEEPPSITAIDEEYYSDEVIEEEIVEEEIIEEEYNDEGSMPAIEEEIEEEILEGSIRIDHSTQEPLPEKCDYMMPLKGGDSHSTVFDSSTEFVELDDEASAKSKTSIFRSNSLRSEASASGSSRKSSRSSKPNRSNSFSSHGSSSLKSQKKDKASRSKSPMKSDGSVKSSRSKKKSDRKSERKSRSLDSDSVKSAKSDDSILSPPGSTKSSRSRKKSDRKRDKKSRNKNVESVMSGDSEDLSISTPPPPPLKSVKSTGSEKSTKSSKSRSSKSPKPEDSAKSSRSKKKLSRHLSLQPAGSKKPERRAPKRSTSIGSVKSSKSSRASRRENRTIDSAKSSKSKKKLTRHLSLMQEGSRKPERRTTKEALRHKSVDSGGSPKSSKSKKKPSKTDTKPSEEEPEGWWQLDWANLEDGDGKRRSTGVKRCRSMGAASVKSSRLRNARREQLNGDGSGKPKLVRHNSMPGVRPSRPERRSSDKSRPTTADPESQSTKSRKKSRRNMKSDGSVKSSKSSRSKKKLSRHLSMPQKGSSKPERRSTKNRKDRSVSPQGRTYLAPMKSPRAGRVVGPGTKESSANGRKRINDSERTSRSTPISASDVVSKYSAPPEREVKRTASAETIAGLEEYRALVKLAVAETSSDVSSLRSSQSSLQSQDTAADGGLPRPPPPPPTSPPQSPKTQYSF